MEKNLCLRDKESACNAGDVGSIPGSGRSPGEGSPLQYSLAWRLHGQRNLACYSQSMGSQRVRRDLVTKQQTHDLPSSPAQSRPLAVEEGTTPQDCHCLIVSRGSVPGRIILSREWPPLFFWMALGSSKWAAQCLLPDRQNDQGGIFISFWSFPCFPRFLQTRHPLSKREEHTFLLQRVREISGNGTD